MKYAEELIVAQRLATEAFEGLTDKVGVPYLYHLHNVGAMSYRLGWNLSRLDDNPNFAVRCMIVGLLHDIVEDTDYSFDDLRREGISEENIVSLSLLTRTKGVPYNDYFESILNSEDKVAIVVKYCDARHNADLMRYPVEQRTKEARRRCRKYQRKSQSLANKIKEWF